MPDRFVHLQGQLVGGDDDVRYPIRAGRRFQQQGGLAGGFPGVPRQLHAGDEFPAGLAGVPEIVGVAPRLDLGPVDGGGVDATARLGPVLGDHRPLGRGERLALPQEPQRSLCQLDLLHRPHLPVGLQQQGDLAVQGHREGVNPDRCGVVAALGRLRRQDHRPAGGQGRGPGDGHSVAHHPDNLPLLDARACGEPPAAGHQHPEPEAGVGAAVDRVDRAVLDGDVFGARRRDADVGIADAGRQGREHPGGELLHISFRWRIFSVYHICPRLSRQNGR